MTHTIIIFVLAVLGATAVAAEERSGVAYGRALVQTTCSRCHAIDDTDTSPHPAAPAFRTLSKRYPLDALEEAFVEGIASGHPDMPEFVATPDQIEAIIAYIGTLQE